MILQNVSFKVPPGLWESFSKQAGSYLKRAASRASLATPWTAGCASPAYRREVLHSRLLRRTATIEWASSRRARKTAQRLRGFRA